MKFLFSLFSLVSLEAFCDSTYVSKVSGFDLGQNSQPHLIFLETGHVLKFKNEKMMVLNDLKTQFNEGQTYSFEADNDRFVLSLNLVKEDDIVSVQESSLMQEYIPTTVKDLSTLKSYFREAPYNPKESQCFNRAMVWGYEWWKKHSLRSMKLFIFFTRDYIRRYNFEWWFHVAPYAHVLVDGKVIERVLDVKYTSGPLSFKQWTDVFMKNDAVCPVITKYSEYADNPYIGDCYIYRANMYFYQPADLQMNEAWGYNKNSYYMNEVRGAYKEAFDIDI